MKVTGFELFHMDPMWLFLKIETDEGITGWGEPILEGKAHTVAAAVDEMMDHVIGRDPMQIERHWQRMMKGGFYRGGAVLNSAVSGIDQALWDIAGKKLGVPIHQLLGGAVRDRIRIYGHVNGGDPWDYGNPNLLIENLYQLPEANTEFLIVLLFTVFLSELVIEYAKSNETILLK